MSEEVVKMCSRFYQSSAVMFFVFTFFGCQHNGLLEGKDNHLISLTANGPGVVPGYGMDYQRKVGKERYVGLTLEYCDKDNFVDIDPYYGEARAIETNFIGRGALLNYRSYYNYGDEGKRLLLSAGIGKRQSQYTALLRDNTIPNSVYSIESKSENTYLQAALAIDSSSDDGLYLKVEWGLAAPIQKDQSSNKEEFQDNAHITKAIGVADSEAHESGAGNVFYVSFSLGYAI